MTCRCRPGRPSLLPGQSAGPHPDSAMAWGRSPGPSSAGEGEGRGPPPACSVGAPAGAPGPPQPFPPVSGPREPLRPPQGRREVPREGRSRPVSHRAGTEGLGIAHPTSLQPGGRASWGRVPGAALEAFSATLVRRAVSGKDLFPMPPPSASVGERGEGKGAVQRAGRGAICSPAAPRCQAPGGRYLRKPLAN